MEVWKELVTRLATLSAASYQLIQDGMLTRSERLFGTDELLVTYQTDYLIWAVAHPAASRTRCYLQRVEFNAVPGCIFRLRVDSSANRIYFSPEPGGWHVWIPTPPTWETEVAGIPLPEMSKNVPAIEDILLEHPLLLLADRWQQEAAAAAR